MSRALPLDTILCGDALDMLRTLPDACVDAIVTDPPAGVGFMGKGWDSSHGGRRQWIAQMAPIFAEALRVLKPGGHALVWALPRTSHWTATALEDAGFEIRDCVTHLFGSGFPKSLDVGKQLDRMARRDYVLAAQRLGLQIPGNNLHDWTKAEHSPGDAWWERFKTFISPEDWQRIEREVTGKGYRVRHESTAPIAGLSAGAYDITAPATDAARQWDGWGTALKPAAEFWWLCRKPLAEGTVAANVLTHGTGALNIAASRVRSDVSPKAWVTPRGGIWRTDSDAKAALIDNPAGRWPPNLLLSHSVWCLPDACAEGCPVAELDRQSGVRKTGSRRANIPAKGERGYGGGWGVDPNIHVGDTGGASRFFPTFHYVAKASRSERNRGCEGLPEVAGGGLAGRHDGSLGKITMARNTHPTVKPLALMSWLITLITPPSGVVLDPFAGSGSTLVAAKQGGWRYLGIEREAEYVAIAEARLAAMSEPEPSLGSASAMPPAVKPTAARKPRAARRKTPPPADAPLWETTA